MKSIKSRLHNYKNYNYCLPAGDGDVMTLYLHLCLTSYLYTFSVTNIHNKMLFLRTEFNEPNEFNDHH